MIRKELDMSKKSNRILGGVIMLVVGLIFVGIATFMMISANNAREKLTATAEGTLLDDGWHAGSEGETMYRPTYSYKVNGKEYKCNSKISSSNMPLESATVYYNASNPQECQTNDERNGSSFMFVIFYIVGGIVAVAGLAFFFIKPKTAEN